MKTMIRTMQRRLLSNQMLYDISQPFEYISLILLNIFLQTADISTLLYDGTCSPINAEKKDFGREDIFRVSTIW